MPPLVTAAATIKCSHGGTVVVVPKQAKVFAGPPPLGAVLCEPDLIGCAIVGCLQPVTQTTKPCTMVVSTTPSVPPPRMLIGGRPPYLVTVSGVTDGVPPGTIAVVNPGQVAAHG
jgi:hypothetical protein